MQSTSSPPPSGWQVDLKHAAKYFTLDAGMIDLSIRGEGQPSLSSLAGPVPP